MGPFVPTADDFDSSITSSDSPRISLVPFC